MILHWVTMPKGVFMKITVEFSDVEKNALFNELNVRDVKSLKSYGKYGEVCFINETNLVYADLNEKFIIATAKLIGNITSMIKGMLQFCEDFNEIWLSDTKTEEYKLVCPVTRKKD